MTHEELLEILEHTAQDDMADEPILKALRAVVELHHRDPKGGCGICSWIINGFVLYEVCPTIQAIQEQLK